MPGQLIQFLKEGNASSNPLQSLILALAGVGPVRTIGNIVWEICRVCIRWSDGLRSVLGMINQRLKTASEQVVYPAAGSEQETATARFGERRSALTMPEPQPFFQPATTRRRTDQAAGVGDGYIFIEVELPPVPSDQATTADIAIPVLLPDFLDSSEAGLAQFFEEHFKVYIENDFADQSTALCLIDSTGQILFSSDPGPVGTLPARPV